MMSRLQAENDNTRPTGQEKRYRGIKRPMDTLISTVHRLV